MLLVQGIGTEKTGRFHFIRIDYHCRTLFDSILYEFLGHPEELIEVHSGFVAQIPVDGAF